MSLAQTAIGQASIGQAASDAAPTGKTPPKRQLTALKDQTLVPEPR